MTQAAVPAPSAGRATTDPAAKTAPRTDRAAWRWAGGLGLGHVVLMLAAFSMEGVMADAHWATEGRTFAGLSVQRVYYASYVEAMAFTLLVPALVLLARRLGRHTETGRVAGQSALGLGLAYVGATLAIGFPPLTTAAFAAHHGADNAVVASVDMLRNYGYVLQVGLSLAFTLALGIAALAGRTLTRWGGVGGITVGAVGLVVTPFAHNAMSMVWIVWWVGLCVLCLKGGPRQAHTDDPTA